MLIFTSGKKFEWKMKLELYFDWSTTPQNKKKNEIE